MKYPITSIHTSIRNHKVWVDFWTNVDTEAAFNEPILSVPIDSITPLFTGIKPLELELLIGCIVEDGYKSDDLRFAGQYNTKTPVIIWPGSMEKLKEINSQHLRTFQQIHSITISSKNNPKPYVIVLTTCNEKYFMNLNYFIGITELNESQLDLLKGAFISPIKYLTGEIMLNNYSIYKGESGKVIKTFNFRFEGTLEEQHTIYGNTVLQPKTTKYKSGLYNDYRRSSYEKYGGYNGFDDQTIDDAFEGDPSATWNVD